MKIFLQYCGLLLLFCLFQSFIFERIQLGPFLYPCIYPLFLLLFPFGYNTIYLLLWAFVVGLNIDISTGVMGIHTSAALCLGMLRRNVLKLLTIKGDLGPLAIPGINTLGLPRYLIYVALSLFIHHAILFGLESFRLAYLHLTLARIVCSTLLNTLLVVFVQAALFNRKHGSDL